MAINIYCEFIYIILDYHSILEKKEKQFEICIPILIIILGSVDLGKAVIASDDKAIKSATGALVKRFIAGIVIFLLPSIVTAVFNMLSGWNAIKSDATNCASCISNPSGSCKGWANDVDAKTSNGTSLGTN